MIRNSHTKCKGLQYILSTLTLSLIAVMPLVAGGEKEAGSEAEVLKETFSFETVGPLGESPVDYRDIRVSDAEIASIRDGNYRAALLMHTSSDWTNAVILGARSMFDTLGVEVVAVTDAEFDSNKQRTDIETALALDPDIIITLVLDPVSGAVALRQAVDKGVKVVLLSNWPNDFVHGEDYVSIVTDDLFGMGEATAELIAGHLGVSGRVALLYHDADYYVTNQRDASVEAVLRRDFPDIEIVTKRGIANPADAETLAAAILTQFPDVDAIYAPWDTIAEGVVAAARGVNSDVSVFTMDLGANNALDMVKGGNIRGVVADLPFVLGETMAKIGVLGVLNREAPAFVTVPAIKVTSENIETEWERSLNRSLPEEIRSEL